MPTIHDLFARAKNSAENATKRFVAAHEKGQGVDDWLLLDYEADELQEQILNPKSDLKTTECLRWRYQQIQDILKLAKREIAKLP